MVVSESRGMARRLTEGLRHRREYESSNPMSQTLGTLGDRPFGRRASLPGFGRDFIGVFLMHI